MKTLDNCVVRTAKLSDPGLLADQRTKIYEDIISPVNKDVFCQSNTAVHMDLLDKSKLFAWFVELNRHVVARAGLTFQNLLPNTTNPMGCIAAFIVQLYTEPAYRRLKKYANHVHLILMMFLSISLLSSCTSLADGTKHAGKQSLYDRVVQSSKIRCAYVLYTPGCIKDPNTGKLSGIGIDVLEIIAKKLGLKLEMVEEAGLETMLEGLKTKRYDMIATPTWTNASRAKLVDFSKPLFYSPIYAYIKSDNRKLKDSLTAINSSDVVIACMDGGTARLVAESDFPKAKLYTLPQMTDFSQVLLTVATGKADVTFVEPALAYGFLQHNPGSIKKVNSTMPMRLFSNCYVFDLGEEKFKSMFNTVLEETINCGQVNKIIDRYEPAPNLVYKIALPYQLPK